MQRADRRSGQDRRNPALGGRRATDHGTRVAYQYDGCRCLPCVVAEAVCHARYAKRLGGSMRRQPVPFSNAWVALQSA
jgi:hypothetical protein